MNIMAEQPTNLTLTDFKKLDESNRWFALWEGVVNIWNELKSITIRINDIEEKVNRHDAILIEGDPENNEPSVLERIRLLEKLALRMEKIAEAVNKQTLSFLFAMILTIVTFLGTFFLKIYPALMQLLDKP